MVKDFKEMVCKDCGLCSIFKWILPIILLAVILVPGWYDAIWAKWVIGVVALLFLLKIFCSCKRR